MKHHWVMLILSVMASQGLCQEESDDWPCDHPIFCKPGEGNILHTVQMAGIFKV